MDEYHRRLFYLLKIPVLNVLFIGSKIRVLHDMIVIEPGKFGHATSG